MKNRTTNHLIESDLSQGTVERVWQTRGVGGPPSLYEFWGGSVSRGYTVVFAGYGTETAITKWFYMFGSVVYLVKMKDGVMMTLEKIHE